MRFSCTGAGEQNGAAVCVTISWTLFSGVLAPSYRTYSLLIQFPFCTLFDRNFKHTHATVCTMLAGSWNGSFFICLAFVASESASAAGSFSNWPGLAPFSTMIGAICRSLSQREKTDQKITFRREPPGLNDRKTLNMGNGSFICTRDWSDPTPDPLCSAFCCFNNNQLLPPFEKADVMEY